MWESPHNCALGPTLSAPTLTPLDMPSGFMQTPPLGCIALQPPPSVFALCSSPDFRQRCLYSCPSCFITLPTQPCPPPAAPTRVSGDLAVAKSCGHSAQPYESLLRNLTCLTRPPFIWHSSSPVPPQAALQTPDPLFMP